MDNTLKKILSC